MNRARCFGVFSVDPVVHRENREFTRDLAEHGGNLGLDFRSKTLVRGSISVGEYNKLQIMERGVVDWHSHPAPCLNANTCTEGLPSPWDLANHVIGALHGSAAHMVYSAEGTYLIQVRAAFLRKLIASPVANQRQYVQRLKRTFLELDKEFKDSTAQYKTYIARWLTLARRMGLIARLFKGNRCPKIKIYYDCHLPADYQAGAYMPDIDIPAKTERFLNNSDDKSLDLHACGTRVAKKCTKCTKCTNSR